jgi:hypothetical protein
MTGEGLRRAAVTLLPAAPPHFEDSLAPDAASVHRPSAPTRGRLEHPHARAATRFGDFPCVGRVVCGIDVDPPNPASEAFPRRTGFVGLGRLRVVVGGQRVSLQGAPAAPPAPA